MRVDELKVGDKAFVVKVTADRVLKQRLITMGFTKGAEIKLEKKAPLGDPLDIFLMDYHVSLRKNEAKYIEVEFKKEKK